MKSNWAFHWWYTVMYMYMYTHTAAGQGQRKAFESSCWTLSTICSTSAPNRKTLCANLLPPSSKSWAKSSGLWRRLSFGACTLFFACRRRISGERGAALSEMRASACRVRRHHRHSTVFAVRTTDDDALLGTCTTCTLCTCSDWFCSAVLFIISSSTLTHDNGRWRTVPSGKRHAVTNSSCCLAWAP